ncbi:MAG: hypothetical protein AAFY36_10125, partial [Bacteroidota bacterium]
MADFHTRTTLFYTEFNNRLKEEVEKGAKASDTQFVLYQSKVTQGADNSTSIKLRRSILKRKLIEFNPDMQNFFNVSEKEVEAIELKKKDTI